MATEEKPSLLQFEPKCAHTHRLIHNNIFKNQFLHVLDLTGPSSGSTLTLQVRNCICLI